MDKRLSWKLPEYLEAHNLTRYQLMTELGDGKGRIAYEWKELPRRLDTEALERMLNALEKLTGGRVELTDVLEYTPPSGPIDAETEAWRSLEGLLDDPVFVTTEPSEIDRTLGEAQEREHLESLAGER